MKNQEQNQNQEPEQAEQLTTEDMLEPCMLHIDVKPDKTTVSAEGSIASISEALASIAYAKSEFRDIIKLSAFLLFNREMEDIALEEMAQAPKGEA